MAAVIDFLIRPLVDRRLYWTSLPILGLVGFAGCLVLQWSYALDDHAPLRISGKVIVVTAVALALWVIGRRMKDASPSWFFWLFGTSALARLVEAGVRRLGGSWGQSQAAFGMVIVLALIGLGFVPSWRPPAAGPDEYADDDEEAARASASP